jgi:DNA-binding transcriptional ArsR family regulator
MVTKVERLRAQKIARLFKLVASPTRTMILSTLVKRGELSVQAIAQEVDMTHSAVSHQLGILSEGNMVDYEKNGRMVRYNVAPSHEAKVFAKLLKAL